MSASTTEDVSRRKYEKPVTWLLGRQLLRSLKGILLYAAYGAQLDPRDWMRPEVFPKAAGTGCFEFWRQQKLKREPPEEMEKEKNKNRSDEDYWREQDGFWFDYISDTGDGMLATYSIAYLCLSDLYAPKSLKAGDKIKTCSKKGEIEDGACLLPRGEFLFVGGDAAYHVSDYITLANRVQKPFEWAYRDVAEERRKSGDHKAAEAEPNRPIFGIPGNHDYYNQLNGFRRQFRLPAREELTSGFYPETENPKELDERPHLYIPGFNKYQQASYVALRLPFDWWLWGLDTEVGEIDERQRDFFRNLCKAEGRIAPRKLIVATCAPTTVFGRLASSEDKKSAGAFKQLGLETLFLPEKFIDTQDFTYLLNTTGDARMEPGQCRLDISGDVHHYARYWGPGTGNANQTEKVREGAKAPAPAAESYASVVSGIGGAFHHPSETYLDQVQEQALYPSEKESTEMVAPRIFWPWQIATGGLIWLAGLLSACIICFAITMTQSVHDFVYDLAELVRHLFSGEPFNKLFGEASKNLFGEYWGMRIGAPLLLLSPVPLILAAVDKKLFEKAPGETNAQREKAYAQRERKLWAMFAASLLAIGTGFYLGCGSRISLFGASLIIQISIIWAVVAIVISVRHSKLIFEKSHLVYIHRPDWILTWALAISGCLVAGSGLWLFGEELKPAHLVSDLIFILVAGGGFIGLTILPVYAGGYLCQPRTAIPGAGKQGTLSVWRKSSKWLFGLWHAILQIGTPYLFANHMAKMTRTEQGALVVIAALLIIAMWQVGRLLLKKRFRKTLAVAWVAYGALTLALPWLIGGHWGEPGTFFPIEFRSGWPELRWPLIAGVSGAVMSCVWFGWYLGVCFAFNGHNNEVGGACRIEEFKQFIRFRLTEDGLTGYVIAVKHPMKQGMDLQPELVDVFHLRVKPSAATQNKEEPDVKAI